MPANRRLAVSLALLPSLLTACGGGGGGGSSASSLGTGGASGVNGTPIAIAYTLNSDHTLSWYETRPGSWHPAGYAVTDTAASGLVISPQGNLYVLENSAGGFRAYLPDSADNTLTNQGFTSVSQPQSAITDPAGSNLYVAGADQITVFPITASGTVGAATQTVSTGTGTVQAFAFSANGSILYTARAGTVQAWTVGSQGSLQALGSPVADASATPVALAVDPLARQIYLADATANTLSLMPLANGVPSVATQNLTLPGVMAVSAASNGQTLYATATDGVQAFGVAAGALTPNGSAQTLPSGSTPVSVALNPGNTELDVASSGSNTLSRWALNSAGALTALPSARARVAPVTLGLTTRTTSESPAYVFASNSLTDTVYGFTVASGSLIPGNTVVAGSAPQDLGTDTGNQLLYVADAGISGGTSGDIRSYRWDMNGVLTPATGPLMTSTNPVALALEPSDRFLYAVDIAASQLYSFATTASGVLTPVTSIPTGTGPQAVVVDPTGQFIYVADKDTAQVSVYQINPATGVPTATSTASVPTDPYALGFDPAGNYLYVTSLGTLATGATTSAGSVTALQINPATGALTPVGSYATGPTPKSVAAAGNEIYVVDSGSDQISEYAQDPFSGTLTPGTTVPATAYPHQFATSHSGTFGVLTGNSDGLLVPYAISTAGSLTPGNAAAIGNGAYAVRIVDHTP